MVVSFGASKIIIMIMLLVVDSIEISGFYMVELLGFGLFEEFFTFLEFSECFLVGLVLGVGFVVIRLEVAGFDV
jgi:hypothetical protein